MRTRDEWDAGHLPNATFIESLHVNKDASRLAGCEDCAIAVYCHSGRRAADAALFLEDAGFAHVYNVLGVQQWTEDAQVALVVSDGDRDPPCAEGAACAVNEIEAASASSAGSIVSVGVFGILRRIVNAVSLIGTR